MTERDASWFFDERFSTLKRAQEALEHRGIYFHPVPREHAEGLITGPLLHRVHTQIKKRGFGNVAGHVAITYSGYARDPREVFAIPEVRSHWRTLDAALPELPALLAVLPEFGFNGPVQYLTLLGAIETQIHRPDAGGYDLYVADAERLLGEATRRIRQAGQRYRLGRTVTANLIAQFMLGIQHRL